MELKLSDKVALTLLSIVISSLFGCLCIQGDEPYECLPHPQAAETIIE